MIPLARAGNHSAAIEYGLRSIEVGSSTIGSRIALDRDAVVRALDLRRVDGVRLSEVVYAPMRPDFEETQTGRPRSFAASAWAPSIVRKRSIGSTP
jgi:hypothetical protein